MSLFPELYFLSRSSKKDQKTVNRAKIYVELLFAKYLINKSFSQKHCVHFVAGLLVRFSF